MPSNGDQRNAPEHNAMRRASARANAGADGKRSTQAAMLPEASGIEAGGRDPSGARGEARERDGERRDAPGRNPNEPSAGR